MSRDENDDLIITQNDKITRYRVKKKVIATGTGAHVLLPKELIGQTVKVELEAGK